ncbi:MAG: hypothetical protein LBD76_04780 [Prevotellaceae bacterium]|nr:hypothetical protein [Prevotellaceae bacterium]
MGFPANWQDKPSWLLTPLRPQALTERDGLVPELCYACLGLYYTIIEFVLFVKNFGILTKCPRDTKKYLLNT